MRGMRTTKASDCIARHGTAWIEARCLELGPHLALNTQCCNCGGVFVWLINHLLNLEKLVALLESAEKKRCPAALHPCSRYRGYTAPMANLPLSVRRWFGIKLSFLLDFGQIERSKLLRLLSSSKASRVYHYVLIFSTFCAIWQAVTPPILKALSMTLAMGPELLCISSKSSSTDLFKSSCLLHLGERRTSK